MANFTYETVTAVHHWNDSLFSFRTTRPPGLRFQNGHFLMLGLEVDHRPLMRAYSLVSANYEEHLEFLSVKVPNGPLTSRLQHTEINATVLVSNKSVGTLVIDDLKPGKRLYLLATGTGLAPFLSIIKDPVAYGRFEQIILVHSARRVSDLAYADFIQHELPENEYIGEWVRQQLLYIPTVTREPFHQTGRIQNLLDKLPSPTISPETDRFMLCGSPDMLKDLTYLLNQRGFQASPRMGVLGDYVIERAFVQKSE